MYNRYIPNNNGGFARTTVQEPPRKQPERPREAERPKEIDRREECQPACITPCEQAAIPKRRSGFRALLPEGLDLGDLLLLCIVLLLLLDSEEEDNLSILITAAAFFLL